MKPIHAIVLILAGALGGAVIMKVAPKAKPAVPVVAVAHVQPQAAPVAATVAEPAPAEVPPEPPAETRPAAVPAKAKPSLMLVRREPARVQRFRPYLPPPVGDLEPVERAAPTPVPEPVPPAPPPTTPTAPPPVNAEPEHATPAIPQSSAAPAPQPHQVTLNAGFLLPVRLVDGLSSERNAPGDVFLATLEKALVVDDFVIAERGARVEGRVVAADRGGKVRGVAALAVELTRLNTSDGQKVAIQTESYFKRADQTHRDDATKVGAGTAIGAVIGALAGGGKGAATGAGLGGSAGAGDVLLTRGKPAELPSEARMTFRLKNAVPLTERLTPPMR
jgi:hypothetical protein